MYALESDRNINILLRYIFQLSRIHNFWTALYVIHTKILYINIYIYKKLYNICLYRLISRNLNARI